MTPEEKELADITELLNKHSVPKHGDFGEYSVYGRVAWLIENAAQHSVHPTLLTFCPECGVDQIVTHLPTCAHYVAQSG